MFHVLSYPTKTCLEIYGRNFLILGAITDVAPLPVHYLLRSQNYGASRLLSGNNILSTLSCLIIECDILGRYGFTGHLRTFTGRSRTSLSFARDLPSMVEAGWREEMRYFTWLHHDIRISCISFSAVNTFTF